MCLFPKLLLLLASATCPPALIPVREVLILAFPNGFRCGLEGGQRRKTTAQTLNSTSFQQTTGDLQNMVRETLLWTCQTFGGSSDSYICETLYCGNGDTECQLLLAHYQTCNNVWSVLRKLSVPCLPCWLRGIAFLTKRGPCSSLVNNLLLLICGQGTECCCLKSISWTSTGSLQSSLCVVKFFWFSPRNQDL